jgi:hypothetical protein
MPELAGPKGHGGARSASLSASSLDELGTDADRWWRTLEAADARLRPWIETFGATNIRLRSLNHANLVGGDLIQDLLAALAVTHPMPPLDRANESPAWTFLEMARDITSRMPDDEPATQEIFRVWLKRLAEISAGALASKSLRPGRAAYLNQRDWIALRDVYNEDVLAINAALPGHHVPLMETAPPPQRGPVPSLQMVPTEILDAYLQAFTGGKLVRSMPPAFRAALRPLLMQRRRRARSAHSERQASQPEDEEQKAQAGDARPPVSQG